MSSTNTGIEWTDKTWNPTTGCDKISPGCQHCYAEAITKRFKQNFPHGFRFTEHPQRLDDPLHWRKPSRIFVNSMSDLFHDEMTTSFLKKIFNTMNSNSQHIFQILTKRHSRLIELAPYFNWTDNIWLGVSVESQNYSFRVDGLRQVPAKVRFLSCEPLLGALDLDLTGIHWVIVGGESGPGYRPIKAQWVKEIRDQTKAANAAFFFKQWGGNTPKQFGRTLDDQIWDEMPQAWHEHLDKNLIKPKKSRRG